MASRQAIDYRTLFTEMSDTTKIALLCAVKPDVVKPEERSVEEFLAWVEPVKYTPIEKLIPNDCDALREVREWIMRNHRPVRAPSPGRPPVKGREGDEMFIREVAANPKRKGSASYARFELYREGMKVKDALAAGVTRGDLKWDSERGFIKIEEK